VDLGLAANKIQTFNHRRGTALWRKSVDVIGDPGKSKVRGIVSIQHLMRIGEIASVFETIPCHAIR
jgi:hypothetical protein